MVCFLTIFPYTWNCYNNLCSFNVHGFNNGADFCTFMSQQLDIIWLQECWLMSSDILPFSNFYDFNKFIILVCMMMKCVILNDFMEALLFWQNLHFFVSDFGCSVNKRIQCMSVEYKDKIFVIFNMYLPCLSVEDYELDAELVCSFMVNIVKNVIALSAAVIVSDDFNVDLTIIDYVTNLNCLKSFINDCRLQTYYLCVPFLSMQFTLYLTVWCS